MSLADKYADAEVVFLPLGGVGEIGMNCALYGFGKAQARKWVMVDMGIAFPDASLPGVDALLPDLTFIENIRDDIAAILVTHAHEDHYGALLELASEVGAPVYGTDFLKHMLISKRKYDPHLPMPDFVNITPYEDIDFGFVKARYIPVAHSIPEANSILLQSEYGNFVHSGDWKLDPDPVIGGATKLSDFEDISKLGIKAVIADSTNAGREGISPSESDVFEGMRKAIANAKGRVLITQFSSNVARIMSIYRAAKACGGGQTDVDGPRPAARR